MLYLLNTSHLHHEELSSSLINVVRLQVTKHQHNSLPYSTGLPMLTANADCPTL